MVFERGLLIRQSNAKERKFLTRSYLLFASLFLIPVILAVAQFSGLFVH